MFLRICSIALLGSACATAFAQESTPEAEVKQLVDSFRRAEQNYDVPALSQLINDRYVEVSPAGEVDAHDRFLGFYAPDKRVDWPPVSVSEQVVRVFGETAMETLKFTYTMTAPGGPARLLEIRGTFVAQHERGIWKLLGVQYTGIRPTPAAK